MSIIKEMTAALGSLFKSDLKLKSINKESFYEYLVLLKTENQILGTCLSNWETKQIDLLTRRVQELVGKKSNKAATVYKQFRGKLTKKAADLESTAVFGSILYVSKEFDEILADIEDNIDNLFQNKNITIANTRVSHLVVFGAIRDFREFVKFGRALFGAITTELSGELGSTAKFRMNAISDHQGVVNTINRVCRGEGACSYLPAINKLSQSGSDLLLMSGNKSFFTDFLPARAFTKTSAALAISGIYSLNLFRFIGEAWNLYQAKKGRLRELDRDWMESRVALIKLDLMGVDHNDPQYLKLIKIIDNYEGMINKLNQEIAKLEDN